MTIFDTFDEAVDEMFNLLRDCVQAIRIDISIDTPKTRTVIYILDCNGGNGVGVWCAGYGAVPEERKASDIACSNLVERLLRNGNIARDRWGEESEHRIATHIVYRKHCPYFIIGDDHDATIAALRLGGNWRKL